MIDCGLFISYVSVQIMFDSLYGLAKQINVSRSGVQKWSTEPAANLQEEDICCEYKDKE